MESKKQSYNTMKGKRRKRQRPQSPFPFPLAFDPMNEEDHRGYDHSNRVQNMDVCDPTSSRGCKGTCTDEEADTANSLILLAQGKLKESLEKTRENFDSKKFSSKRISNDNGNARYYVYECITCNRTFPSFQALGGHRASHKKSKPNHVREIVQTGNNIVEGHWENPKSVFGVHPSYNDRGTQNENILHNPSMNENSNKKSYKVHECGICRAEFNSGQALGGHMRRHKGLMSVPTNKVLSFTTIHTEPDNQERSNKVRTILSLDLDLNLPAPEVDDNLQFGSHYSSKHEEEQRQEQLQHKKTFSCLRFPKVGGLPPLDTCLFF